MFVVSIKLKDSLDCRLFNDLDLEDPRWLSGLELYILYLEVRSSNLTVLILKRKYGWRGRAKESMLGICLNKWFLTGCGTVVTPRHYVINDALRCHFSSIFSNPLMTSPLAKYSLHYHTLNSIFNLLCRIISRVLNSIPPIFYYRESSITILNCVCSLLFHQQQTDF